MQVGAAVGEGDELRECVGALWAPEEGGVARLGLREDGGGGGEGGDGGGFLGGGEKGAVEGRVQGHFMRWMRWLDISLVVFLVV